MLLLRGATAFRCRWELNYRFQYMLLLRGATQKTKNRNSALPFQYMLLLRGATARSVIAPAANSRFNTCSSCEEQRRSRRNARSARMFQYMLLLRGATRDLRYCHIAIDVSIHAPLARSNRLVRIESLLDRSFNTCSSCEEQHFRVRQGAVVNTFQYMLLLRGATGVI